MPSKKRFIVVLILVFLLAFLIKVALVEYFQNYTFKAEYQQNKTFCLTRNDCVVQTDCFCCDDLVNKFNITAVKCNPYGARCEAVCPKIMPICIMNVCRNIYNLDYDGIYDNKTTLFLNSNFLANFLNARSQKR